MLDIEVGVVSTMRHVRGETKDRSEWATTVTSSGWEVGGATCGWAR